MGAIRDFIDSVSQFTQDTTDTISGFLPNNRGRPAVGSPTASPDNHRMETKSGHIISYNDTPGEEEISFRHKNGSTTFSLKPNGDIEMSTRGAMVYRAENHVFQGNVDMRAGTVQINASGDMVTNVGGSMKTGVAGDYGQSVDGNARYDTYGNQGSIVNGSVSTTALGGITTTSFTGMNVISKGNHRTSIQGEAFMNSSGGMKITSGGSMGISSPDIDMGASSLSLFGASGTIGGSGMVFHGTTFFGDTFNGNLQGDVKGNVEGDLTGDVKGDVDGWSKEAGVIAAGSPPSVDAVSGDFITIGSGREVGADDMSEYLSKGEGAVVDVQIDPNGEIENMIDRTADTGGATDKPLTLEQIREKMRDPAYRDNEEFTNAMVEEGRLDPSHAGGAPRGVAGGSSGGGGGYGGGGGGAYYPSNGGGGYARQEPACVSVPPVAEFDPNNLDPQNERTFKLDGTNMIGPGIPLSTFTPGYDITKMESYSDRMQAARYAHIHATQILNRFKDNELLGENDRLQVVGGLYIPGKDEVPTEGSINDYASKGRVAVYQVIGPDGNVDHDKTFELAKLIHHNLPVDVSLDYDTYTPEDGSGGVHTAHADKRGKPVSTSQESHIVKSQVSEGSMAIGGYGPPAQKLPVNDKAVPGQVTSAGGSPLGGSAITGYPSKKNTAPRVTVTLPELDENYNVVGGCSHEMQTTFNNRKQSNSFIKIDPEKRARVYTGGGEVTGDIGRVKQIAIEIHQVAGAATGLDVVVSSGYRTNSPNHITGTATDVHLYEEDGTMIDISTGDPQHIARLQEYMDAWLGEARRRGIERVGVGIANYDLPHHGSGYSHANGLYMQGTAFHLDLVNGHSWGGDWNNPPPAPDWVFDVREKHGYPRT
jgi:hypothetical protein